MASVTIKGAQEDCSDKVHPKIGCNETKLSRNGKVTKTPTSNSAKSSAVPRFSENTTNSGQPSLQPHQIRVKTAVPRFSETTTNSGQPTLQHRFSENRANSGQTTLQPRFSENTANNGQPTLHPGQSRVKTAVSKTFKKLGINSALSPNKGNVTDNNKTSLLGGWRTQKNRDFFRSSNNSDNIVDIMDFK